MSPGALATDDQLRSFVELVPDAILLVSPEGRIILANTRCASVLGYPRDLLEGMEVEALIPERFRAQHIRHRREFMRSSRSRAMGAGVELWALRQDATEIPVEISLGRLQLNGSEVVAATVRDVSERKREAAERARVEAKVQQAQRLEGLGILAGGIAHDFNNILVGILGHADLAFSELPASAPGREDISRIRSAARQAADLCNQMLAYSGKGRFTIHAFHLSDAVTDMYQLLKASIPKNVLLRREFSPSGCPIAGDPSQIRQIVLNLITNASEAIGTNAGVIYIRTGSMDATSSYLREGYVDDDLPAGRYVYLEVSDTGCGMDKGTQARIFDPFFTTKFAGRGLGLAAVLGIARGHRASVRVSSEIGKGTTIRILFPSSDATATKLVPEGEVPHDWQASGTVLVIDDEEIVRTVASRMLRRRGFDVLTAAGGTEAVRLARESSAPLRAALLDLSMPGMDAEEVFRELRHLLPEVGVILMSGYNEQEATSRFVGRGLADFIQKPFSAEQLLGKLYRVLERTTGRGRPQPSERLS